MEPLSAFSLSLVILNIFLNTIPQIVDKGDQIINLKERLQRHFRTLQDCQASFALWIGRWDRPHEKEAILKETFGSQGWISIQERKADVLALLDHVRDYLCLTELLTDRPISTTSRRTFSVFLRKFPHLFRTKLAPTRNSTKQDVLASTSLGHGINDAERWQKFVRSLEEESPRPTPDPSVTRRILGILYLNQHLDNKINDLDKELAKLHTFTSNRYALMGHGRTEPEPEDVETTVDKIKFRKIAKKLLECSTNRELVQLPATHWYLELRVPYKIERSGDLINQMIGDCAMYFTTVTRLTEVEPLTALEVKSTLLKGASILELKSLMTVSNTMRTFYKNSPEFLRISEVGILELRKTAEPESCTHSWRKLLRVIETENDIRKFSQLARARTALGFALWIVLLWDTEWFKPICSCALQNVLHLEEQGQHEDGEDDTAKAHRNEPIYTTAHSRNHPPDFHCDRNSGPKDKLYFFGIVLAELLLGKPTSLATGSSTPLRPTGDFRSNMDILIALESLTGPGRPVKRAVQFCFDHATDPEWTTPTGAQYFKHTKLLVEKVLEPVRVYYELVNSGSLKDEWASKFLSVLGDHKQEWRFESPEAVQSLNIRLDSGTDGVDLKSPN
jgi:hypothetical protein